MQAIQETGYNEQYFNDLGYEEVKQVKGCWVGGYRFLFTYGICVGLNDTGYCRRFCFDTKANALLFLNEWDGNSDPVIGVDGCTAIK